MTTFEDPPEIEPPKRIPASTFLLASPGSPAAGKDGGRRRRRKRQQPKPAAEASRQSRPVLAGDFSHAAIFQRRAGMPLAPFSEPAFGARGTGSAESLLRRQRATARGRRVRDWEPKRYPRHAFRRKVTECGKSPARAGREIPARTSAARNFPRGFPPMGNFPSGFPARTSLASPAIGKDGGRTRRRRKPGPTRPGKPPRPRTADAAPPPARERPTPVSPVPWGARRISPPNQQLGGKAP